MILDMNNPASIAAWYKTCPKRHGQMLKHWLTRPAWAQFHAAIAASRELI